MSAGLLTALYSALTDDAAVAALVGARVYPEVPVQNAAYPQVAYQVDQAEWVGDLGRGAGPLEVADITVECWADDLVTAMQVADAVVEALDATTLFYLEPSPSQDTGFEASDKRWQVTVDATVSYQRT